MEERLDAKADADDAEASDGHVHGGGAGDNNGAHSAEECEDDEEPFSSPVVGGLGGDGAEDDGEDGDGSREPRDVGRVVEVAGNGLALLLNAISTHSSGDTWL